MKMLDTNDDHQRGDEGETDGDNDITARTRFCCLHLNPAFAASTKFTCRERFNSSMSWFSGPELPMDFYDSASYAHVAADAVIF